MVGAFYLVVIEHCELLDAGGDDARIWLSAKHGIDGGDEDLGTQRAIVIHTSGEIEDECTVLSRLHIVGKKRLSQVEHLLLLAARVGNLPTSRNGGEGLAQALERDPGHGTEQTDAVFRARDESCKGVGTDVDVSRLLRRKVDRGGRAQALEGVGCRHELGEEDIEPFTRRRATDGQGRGEPRTHVWREALGNRIGQAGAPHDALDGMQHLEMS